MPHWFAEARARVEAYSNALFDRWVFEATLAAYIDMPIRVEVIVGYDPQKLLPYKHLTIKEWSDQWGRHSIAYGPLYNSDGWIAKYFDDAENQQLATYARGVLGETYASGGYIDFETASPTARRLAPFVSPISELRSRGLTPTGRRIADFVDPRWPKALDDEDDARLNVVKRAAQGKTEEPIATIGGGTHVYQSEINKRLADAGIEVIVVHAGTDYRDLELRVMAANADPKIKSLYIDIDHADERFVMRPDAYNMFKDFDLPIKAETPKKQPDYLKHDPSKHHRRRRRK